MTLARLHSEPFSGFRDYIAYPQNEPRLASNLRPALVNVLYGLRLSLFRESGILLYPLASIRAP